MSEDSTTLMWRGAIIPSTLVAIVALTGSSILSHRPGFFGALIGSATVIIFLGVHLLVSAISKNLDPIAVMGMAMFSYFAKFLGMGALLLIVSRATAPATVDRTTFAIAALAITAAWLAGEIRAFFKLKIGLPLPPVQGENLH
jgi:ATP synthase protein I